MSYFVKAQKICIFFSIMLSLVALPAVAQDDWETLRECPATLMPEVTFIESAPEIDGILDDHLKNLPVRQFNLIQDRGDKVSPEVTYRLGYGTEFFYVYIEAIAGKMIYRDRGYQHGDGFSMVLAAPRADNAPTDEFYVLACAAVNEPKNEWFRHIFWYYNVDDIFVRTSKDTKLEFNDGDGIISFELLLPWKDVHPYHPWLSDGIGFNLRFVKGTDDGGKIDLQVFPDNKMTSENSNRKYTLLNFEKPQLESGMQTYVVPYFGNIIEDKTIPVKAATVAADSTEEDLVVKIVAGEGGNISYQIENYPCRAGLTQYEFEYSTKNIPSGGYMFEWYSRANDSKGEKGLSILPVYDKVTLSARIDEVKDRIAKSSYHTLLFYAQEIAEVIASLKPYETAAEPRVRLQWLFENIEQASIGKDEYMTKTGLVRKAYLSELDTTLQPYIVSVPETIEPGKKYPLIVFLHGSASDETNIEGFSDLIPENCFGLGPKGRGPSNGWSRDHAQDDIAEAIASVLKDYPIDPEKIIISGFSMGGYGVYRTFFEKPEKFRALAVLSGAPNMGGSYAADANPPDFTEEQNLKPFRNKPIFIFHGEQDRNVSFQATKDFIIQLEKAGARVEFVSEPETGHSGPNEETMKKYRQWLERVLAD